MEHTDIHDLTAAYALDALEAGESREFERHLRHCERCREELAQLQEPATALAYGAPHAVPSPGLRNRILEQARGERPNVVPMRRRWASPATALAAAAAVAAIGVGIWAASVSSSLSEERAARERLEQVTEILGQPGAQRIALQGASGELVVGSAGQAALVLTRLEPAPPGKTYEAWVIEPGASPEPAGIFRAGEGKTVFALERPVRSGATVAVTVEPDGGVEEPTSDPIFSAERA